jgi:hypothetical protein
MADFLMRADRQKSLPAQPRQEVCETFHKVPFASRKPPGSTERIYPENGNGNVTTKAAKNAKDKAG